MIKSSGLFALLLIAIGLLFDSEVQAKDLNVRITALNESHASGFYSGLARERAITRPYIAKISNFSPKLKLALDKKQIQILETKVMSEEKLALNSKLKFGDSNLSLKLEHKSGILHLVSRSGKDEPVVFDEADDFKIADKQTLAINTGLQMKSGPTYYNIIIFITK